LLLDLRGLRSRAPKARQSHLAPLTNMHNVTAAGGNDRVKWRSFARETPTLPRF